MRRRRGEHVWPGSLKHTVSKLGPRWKWLRVVMEVEGSEPGRRETKLGHGWEKTVHIGSPKRRPEVRLLLDDWMCWQILAVGSGRSTILDKPTLLAIVDEVCKLGGPRSRQASEIYLPLLGRTRACIGTVVKGVEERCQCGHRPGKSTAPEEVQ